MRVPATMHDELQLELELLFHEVTANLSPVGVYRYRRTLCSMYCGEDKNGLETMNGFRTFHLFSNTQVILVQRLTLNTHDYIHNIYNT